MSNRSKARPVKLAIAVVAAAAALRTAAGPAGVVSATDVPTTTIHVVTTTDNNPWV